MASVKWLQGVLLGMLKESEYRGSHPEKMIEDKAEMARIVFSHKYRGPLQLSDNSEIRKRQLAYANHSNEINSIAEKLLKKMKK